MSLRHTANLVENAGSCRGYLRVDGKTTLEYNPRGLLTGVVSPEATLRFEHDAAGRIVAEDQDGVRLERTLDVMGRSVAYTTPFGPSTHFSWSPAGACMRVTHGDAEVRFERDALGREVGRQLGGAGRFEQSYDPVGRLMSQTFAGTGLPGGGSGDTMQRSFAYDARGFLLQIHDSLRGATALRHNDRGDLTAVLRERGWSDVAAYDGCQSRVFYAMTEQRAALAEAFEQAALMRAHGYDETPPDRLIERVPHVGQSQSYATGNRTVLLTRTDGTRTELRYDVNGRVVSKVRIRGPDRDEWRYAWDSRGRMVSMTTPNGAVWKYRYDATARRIEKQGPTGETWRYLWRGQDMVQTLHNGELVETYVHDPGGTCPLLRLDETGVRHILPDQNHSPSEEVGANGQVKWLARKGTWGEGWRHHGHAGGEPFLGQWYDAESGLHYNRFRYYDPDTGRYLSTDPIGLAGGLNLYMGISDPYSNFDRDGLSADDDGGPYIYRGVSANHPELPAAKEGRVVPGNVGGTVSADAHNLGGEAADSSFTSWTHNKNIALYHANKDGPGGVLLRVRPGAPPDGATWSWEWSPDEYGESEVLLKGKRQGDIEVLDPC